MRRVASVISRSRFRTQRKINGSSRNFSSSRSRHRFTIDTACRGKDCPTKLPSSSPPQPNSCGEDSFFVQGTNTLGVSDGVGGWRMKNIDPAIISQSLMRYAAIAAAESPNATPIQILTTAYRQTLEDPKVYAGSTTACIIKLVAQQDDKLKLQYANLGDSGLLIVRHDEIVFQSTFQKYGGYAPYQLAKIPPELKSHGAIESKLEEADCGDFEVQEGDVIVLATDGVWDNFAEDLHQRGSFLPPVQQWFEFWHGPLESMLNVLNAPGDKAQNILQAALRHNLKPDDVTVIVATVQRDGTLSKI